MQRRPRVMEGDNYSPPSVIRVFALLIALAVPTSFAADWPTLHGNNAHTGYSDEQLKFPLQLQWAVEFENERFFTADEAIISSNHLYLTAQSGTVFQLDLQNGKLIDSVKSNQRDYRYAGSGSFIVFRPPDTDVPLRQVPAESEGALYVVFEDLRLRKYDRAARRYVWTSEQMYGQTARDYYPVVVGAAGKQFVIVRTNPVLNMAKQIADDRNFLTRQAGIDASDWKKLDAWIKGAAAAGTPELIAREQDAVVHYLETNKWAQTFYVFDAETGKRAFTPPIMWVGGCQGVGTPPAITKEGKAVVLYRSAYGNWNHGVAPLVALGLLNFETGRIEPLRHNQGPQPPWNTFWGTADEAQNFTIANDDLIIVHQGTLSRFNLVTHNLEKIWGERDSYGGFKNPSWARNEWHGPARGGVAISNGHIYWLTGSRLLCLGSDKPAEVPKIKTIPGGRESSPPVASLGAGQAKTDLSAKVREALSKNWAPLYVEPGLAGREFFFADTRELFTALAWAYPHLDAPTQRLVRDRLSRNFKQLSPISTNAFLDLKKGERREYFAVPEQVLTRLGNDKPPLAFGSIYSAWLYAERCHDWANLLSSWDDIYSSFHEFLRHAKEFGPGRPYYNRYLSSLMALSKIAKRAKKDFETESMADIMVKQQIPHLVQWWKEAGATLTNFNGSQQLDPFIQKGDKLSWAVFPHRHKLAIFQDMTPEIGEIIRREAPDAAAQVWSTFTNLAPTWYRQGVERQYHFGENFVDTPDFALSAFQALAFVQKAKTAELLDRVDIPFCKADLYHLQKLAIALEAGNYP